MDELLPVIVGGAIGLAGGLIGSVTTLWLAKAQAARDNDQWIRQRRLDAYLPVVAFLREFEYRASVYFDLMSRVEGVIPRDATAEQISEMRAQYAADGAQRISSELLTEVPQVAWSG